MRITSLTRTSPPSGEPISTAEAKAHLRVSASTDDTLIDAQIKGAREWAEGYTGRAFITQTWTMTLDEFPNACRPTGARIEIPRPPLTSVTSVKYYDAAGAQQTLVAGTDFVLIKDGDRAWVAPAPTKSWPTSRTQDDAVEIVYVAGYGNAAAVPELVKRALCTLVQQQFDNLRPEDDEAAERAVGRMLRPLKRIEV